MYVYVCVYIHVYPYIYTHISIQVRVLPRTLRCFVADLGPADKGLDPDHKASTASLSASGAGMTAGHHVTDQVDVARTETGSKRSGCAESWPQAPSAAPSAFWRNNKRITSGPQAPSAAAGYPEYAGKYVF